MSKKKIKVLCNVGDVIKVTSGMQGEITSIISVLGVPYARFVLLTPCIVACANMALIESGVWEANYEDVHTVNSIKSVINNDE